jgi:hypothetical protein
MPCNNGKSDWASPSDDISCRTAPLVVRGGGAWAFPDAFSLSTA